MIQKCFLLFVILALALVRPAESQPLDVKRNNPCDSLIGASGEVCGVTGPPPEDTLPISPGLVAYPNPFSSQLTITFSAPEKVPTSIRIFDVRGRVIRTYTSESQEGNFIWDGRDERGRSASPGVYFIRMRAGSVERVTRAVLVP